MTPSGWLTWDWGDVPTWIASIVVSLSIGGGTVLRIRREIQDQASRVIVYAVAGRSQFEILLVNQSSAPVTFPVVFTRWEEVLPLRGGEGWKSHFVPAGATVTIVIDARLDELEVGFTDRNRRRWRVPLLGSQRPRRCKIEAGGGPALFHLG